MATGYQEIDISTWKTGDTILISQNTQLKSSSTSNSITVPKVTIVIEAGVTLCFSTSKSFQFNSGTTVDLGASARLLINADVTFGAKSSIHAEKGKIVINFLKTLTIETKSIIYLKDYPITGSGKMVADKLQLESPAINCFSNINTENINLKCDYCYPQWFGAVAYDTLAEAKTNTNIRNAEAFTKALNAINGGVVVVPRGFYRINKTITAPNGAKLRGISTTELTNPNGSVLLADFEESSEIQNLIVLNQKSDGSDEWEQNNPLMSAKISNLYLINKNDNKMRAIVSYDSVWLDNVIFGGFFQAIKYSNCYLDSKQVTNCAYYFSKDFVSQTFLDKIEEDDKLYAFDMGFLGDSLLFEHNAIHDGAYNKGLKINNAGCASINANIINADVMIKSSKAVDFTANHLEKGHIVEISCSEVTSRSNFYWVTDSPAIQISSNEYKDESIVTLENDVFRVYMPDFYKEDELEGKTFVTEAEISIDQNSRLNLINAYRYRGGDNFGKMYTTGVKIYKNYNPASETNELFEEFNRYCYKLSQNCQISSDYKIETSFVVDKFEPASTPVLAMTNDDTRWVGDKGFYAYSYQILLDGHRHLGWPTGELMTVPVHTAPDEDSPNKQKSVSAENAANSEMIEINGKGVLFVLQGPINGVLRLVRKKVGEASKYADIPLSGTCYIYDNGVSVHGYPWNNHTSDIELLDLANPEWVEIKGTKAQICTSENIPAENLEKGDVLLNAGTNESWNIKIIK